MQYVTDASTNERPLKRNNNNFLKQSLFFTLEKVQPYQLFSVFGFVACLITSKRGWRHTITSVSWHLDSHCDSHRQLDANWNLLRVIIVSLSNNSKNNRLCPIYPKISKEIWSHCVGFCFSSLLRYLLNVCVAYESEFTCERWVFSKNDQHIFKIKEITGYFFDRYEISGEIAHLSSWWVSITRKNTHKRTPNQLKPPFESERHSVFE